MTRTLAATIAVLLILLPAASADRWLIERGPNPADLPADGAWLADAAELLLRADLAELKGVALLSKADVKSDIATLELNRLASAKGDVRLLTGKFARAKGLLVIEFLARGESVEMRLTASDLTRDGADREERLTLAEAGLEESVAALAAASAKFLGRAASAEELARMKRPTGLTAGALKALAQAADSKEPAERERLAKLATTLAPDAPLAWYLYARELHASGKVVDAISAYRSCVKLDDACSAFHYDLGNAFFDDKRCDEAQVEYARAIALDPAKPECHENLVAALKARRLAPADVLAEYRKVAAANPDVAVAHLVLARLLVEQVKLDEALAEFRKACDMSPTDPIVRFDLAHALEQAGSENEAFYEYKEAIQLAPNYAKALNNVAYLYEKKEKLDLALYYYNRAVSYAPDYALAWNNLGILYGKRGKFVLEVGAFRQQVKLTPKDPVAWYNLGVGCHHAGEIENAVASYKRALELKPDDRPTHWQLAHAYERQNLLNLAADEWKKVLALNPTAEEKATAEKHLKEIGGK